jgi:hypothetical protein
MSNKRVSQLVELGASEVSGSDLLYIVDVSTGEGKKIQASSFSAYLGGSGSLNAIHAINADTASYVLGSNVAGTVTSASYALNSTSAKTASFASSSVSSSYALTASFALNANAGSTVSASWASASISSSFATNALNATNALSAAFLIYTGANNGTASYAMKAKLAETTTLALTASYISSSGLSVTSASWSDRSGHADIADSANSSLFLDYTGAPNGTASYALNAGNFVSNNNNYSDYGIFLATTQSISSSQLDLVTVSASNGATASTDIEAWGTIIVPYTSSIPVNETLTLIAFNRDTGFSSSLDSTPIFVNMTKIIGNWDAEVTGTVKIPFSLVGSSSLYGSYLIYVTGSSSKIEIDSARTNRFNISSKSDSVTVSVGELALFNVTPSTISMSFTSSGGGPFVDNRAGIISTGSANIYVLDLRGKSASSLRYVWSLTNLTTLDCGQTSLTSLTGMPNTLVTMSCDSCSIVSMTSLVNTTMSYFNCGNNFLSTLPELPTSLSYMDCSTNSLVTMSGLPNTMSFLDAGNNFLQVLPSSFPSGLTNLYLNDNSMTSFDSATPNTLLTMSLARSPIISWSTTMATSLKKLDIESCPLNTLPNLSPVLTYLNAISCSLSQGAMTTVLSQSYSNAVTNNLTGSILLNGNGYITVASENSYVLPLQAFGWTVGYDGSV